MPRTDYQRLIDRGRKAGLGTGELYRALRARRPEAGDLQQTDSNGYIGGYGNNGRWVMTPYTNRPLS